jgi:hypothetical protein
MAGGGKGTKEWLYQKPVNGHTFVTIQVLPSVRVFYSSMLLVQHGSFNKRSSCSSLFYFVFLFSLLIFNM